MFNRTQIFTLNHARVAVLPTCCVFGKFQELLSSCSLKTSLLLWFSVYGKLLNLFYEKVMLNELWGLSTNSIGDLKEAQGLLLCDILASK